MNEELFGVIHDADEVMESVNCDPFGMNVLNNQQYVSIYEGMDISKKSLDDPKVVMKLKKQLKNAKRWDVVLRTIQKLNAILAGLTAGAGAATTAVSTISGTASKATMAVTAKKFEDYNTQISAVNQQKIDAYNAMASEYNRRAQSLDPRDIFTNIVDGNPAYGYDGITGSGKLEEPTLIDPTSTPKGQAMVNTALKHQSNANKMDELAMQSFKFTVTVILIHTAIAVLTSLLRVALRRNEVKNISMLEGQIDKSITLYKSKMATASAQDKQKLEESIKNLEEIKSLMNSESARLNR